jgi:hypothetical protein
MCRATTWRARRAEHPSAHPCASLPLPQLAGLLGVAIAALYVFQEKILYVPVVPGVPADYWVEPERYGLAGEVRASMRACVRA